MYSWDRDVTVYKYEAIQYGSDVLEYEDEMEQDEDYFAEITEEEFDE